MHNDDWRQRLLYLQQANDPAAVTAAKVDAGRWATCAVGEVCGFEFGQVPSGRMSDLGALFDRAIEREQWAKALNLLNEIEAEAYGP